jgi:hypothetical protein
MKYYSYKPYKKILNNNLVKNIATDQYKDNYGLYMESKYYHIKAVKII